MSVTNRRSGTAGSAIREELVDRIDKVLKASDHVSDSLARLQIQGECLDLLTLVETIINRFELERQTSPKGMINLRCV